MERLVNNKKYLTLILVGLLTMIIGISLSYIYFDLSTGDNIIQSGHISMTYIEPSNEIILKDQLPISDELGKNQDKYFEFSVISNATTNENDSKGVDIFYEISLSKTEVEDIYNELEDKDVKIYLTKIVGEEEKVVVYPTLISELEKSSYGDAIKIYDTKNKHKNNNGSITTKYRLRFWIDNNVNATNWYKEDKYEYRFVVNINAHAPHLDLTTDNTLATKIKTAYNPENGAAVVDKNGYHYLQGSETLVGDPSTKLLGMFGSVGGVYLYRQEVDAANVQPTSNIKKINDTKQYIFNQVLLENDIKNFFINSGEATLEEYEAMTDPFGGYVNAVIGMVAGVVTDSMEYVQGKTIADIPSINEVMADDDMKLMFIEYISEFVSSAINKDSFMQMYSKGDAIDTGLLNANLEVGALLLGGEKKVNIINTNFGNLSNYVVAEVSELVDYDTMGLIEGKTIKDIPTLEIFFLKEGPVLLTNTYVKLNDILWKVMGVNEDDTIKLISTYRVRINADGPLVDGNVGKFLGYNDYKYPPFMALINGTTLEDIIVKSEFKYNDEGVEGKVFSYAGMPSYEDLTKSIKDGYSYLIDTNISFNNMSVSTSFIKQVMSNKIKYYKYFYNDTNDDNLTKEGEISWVDLYPVITIKNIDVIGDGSKTNPYKIENEKLLTESGFAKSVAYSKLYALADGKNDTYGKLGLYDNIYTEHNLSFDKTGTHQFNNISYSTGVSVNNKCYYETIDGTNKVIDYSGNCSDKFVSITTQPISTINTYSYNATTMSVAANNVTSYQWQQKVGDEWVNLEDMTGRIEGTNTNTLKIIPTSNFASINYFRCIIKNEVSKLSTNEITMNLVLTDGEFVYEEIDDTNKFQIISYIGNPADSLYFTLLDDGTNYHLDFPTTINGDSIVNIKSAYETTSVGSSTWSSTASKITSLELPSVFESTSSIFSGCPLTNLVLSDELLYISDSAFSNSKLTEIVIPRNVLTIGKNAFYNTELTSLTLNDKVETIEAFAFHVAKLTTLEIPASVTDIGSDAFENSELTELVLHEGLVNIGIGAFNSAKLTSLHLPSTVKTLGDNSFQASRLTKLVIPNGVEYIGTWTFGTALLTELEIPASVKHIATGAFEDSPLKKLILHEGLEEIAREAFYSSNLTSLSIPASVVEIQASVFGFSTFTDLKIYGKTSVSEFGRYASFNMADGYEPQFIEGTLE